MILPDAFNCVYLCFNPFATKTQCENAINVGLHFLNLIKNKNEKFELFDDYNILIKLLTSVRAELSFLNASDFSFTYYPEFNRKTELLQQMNEAIEKNETKPIFKVIENVLQDNFDRTDPDLAFKTC